MELKNAVAVCLISLCSATLVVLIARWLDVQTAERIEPQLTSIVEELRALRKQGGAAASRGSGAVDDPQADCLTVYYFHNDYRCPDCRAMESQAKETVQKHFASQLESGEVAWKTVNYVRSGSAELALKFGITDPVVVLARIKDGQVRDGWRRLDKARALVSDKPAFIAFVRGEIDAMLTAEKQPATEAAAPNIPIPGDGGVPNQQPPSIPIPEQKQ